MVATGVRRPRGRASNRRRRCVVAMAARALANPRRRGAGRRRRVAVASARRAALGVRRRGAQSLQRACPSNRGLCRAQPSMRPPVDAERIRAVRASAGRVGPDRRPDLRTGGATAVLEGSRTSTALLEACAGSSVLDERLAAIEAGELRRCRRGALTRRCVLWSGARAGRSVTPSPRSDAGDCATGTCRLPRRAPGSGRTTHDASHASIRLDSYSAIDRRPSRKLRAGARRVAPGLTRAPRQPVCDVQRSPSQ